MRSLPILAGSTIDGSDKGTLVGYYFRSLTPRRRSTIPFLPETAAEVPKSVELELRIARLELVVKDLLDQIERQDKATVALRAELDHLTARLFHI